MSLVHREAIGVRKMGRAAPTMIGASKEDYIGMLSPYCSRHTLYATPSKLERIDSVSSAKGVHGGLDAVLRVIPAGSTSAKVGVLNARYSSPEKPDRI